MLIHGHPAPETWFRGGLVLYAGSEIPLARDMRAVASKHGVVSEEYAAAMARFARRAFACDWALAESGIAGPQTGRRSAKPVGMVCLAVAGPPVDRESTSERGTSPRATGRPDREEDSVWTATRLLPDAGRAENQRQFGAEALALLRYALQERAG